MKRNIAVFDFDGTITTKDTLIEFIKFAKGNVSFYCGFILYSPLLIAFKLKLYPNWKIKKIIFNHFFKGMKYAVFCSLGEEFIYTIQQMVRPKALIEINKYLQSDTKIYVISASVNEWVSPWCKSIGIENIIGTNIEVDDSGYLTGNFLSKNCYGQEKVNRLLKVEPDRKNYVLHGYGDSRGDKELIEFADSGWYNKFK